MAQQALDHQHLFNARLLARSAPQAAAPPAHQLLLTEWAETIRSGAIRQRNEQQIRGAFTQKFFCELLGYKAFGSGSEFTLADENYVGKGRADILLGRFGPHGDSGLVPVELKGADTPNLDVMMPGRYKSPVQQVWEYAMDLPNCKFLLLSNMLEIRLYAVGHTRRVYERFDLLEVADSPAHYQRLMLLLGADNLLGGRTAALLNESGQIEKQITRELYADYKRWRIQLITALAHANDLAPGALITPAQKLLDRVLFIAFAQQRGLLPADTLRSVNNSSGWAVVPKYEHYKTLFRAIDKGLPERGIPPYNGGLFAPDGLLDNLSVPNAACDMFMEFGKYDFGGEVSVNVLGHIFEQSITDLEQLKELADTGAFTLEAITRQAEQARAATSSVNGARKEHGIVYTPEFITAFIVDQTLGKTIESRRAEFLCNYQISGEWRKPAAEEKKYAKTLAQPERVVELIFWRAWLAELITLKVCDPACGSGAFLVAAFDVLLAEYNNVNEQIAVITGSMEVFNADKEILNSNLFGVDLNAESIEITKLSLWLKTAKHGKPLESLEANLRVGNSLVSSADGGLEFDPKAFNWTSAFPGVVAQGGFDVIVGNPPYVRMERLKGIKPYLEKRYAVATDRADLYCYFFELGIRLLREVDCNGNAGGRLGFISSSTFFKTGSGEKLRAYLLAHAQIETVVDFGDLQVFEGVTTYPVIITLQRSGAPDAAQNIKFLTLKTEVPGKLIEAFNASACLMPQGQLGSESWRLEDRREAALRYKLQHGRKTLKEVYGSPYRGLLTGLNEAFVLDGVSKDRLISEDPRSAALIKPFLRGENLKKWRVEAHNEHLLLIKNGSTRLGFEAQQGQTLVVAAQAASPAPTTVRAELVEALAWQWFSSQQPAVARWLQSFEPQARKRSDQGEFWWELRACAYYDKFDSVKLVYVDMSDKPNFSIETQQSVMANTGYFVADADHFLLALMVSKAMWFLLTGMTSAYRGGFYRLFTQHVETLPIPEASQTVKARLVTLAQSAQTAAESRRDEIARFGRAALRDLVPGGLSNLTAAGGAKLPAAWQSGVPEFGDFTAELKKRFKRELNLTERNDWDAAVTQARERVAAFTQAITQAELEIDAIVYQLFELTAEEIRLIEEK
nr:N-6 DNA methylase [Rhodoferax sp.]